MFSPLIKGPSLLYEKFFSAESIPRSDHLESILNFYDEQEALDIIVQVLSNLNTKETIISEDMLTWCLQILGFSLRYLDKDYSTLKKSLEIYIEWIRKLPLKNPSVEENDRYVEIFIYHLSQAFSSLTFHSTVESIVDVLSAYILDKQKRNYKLVSLYVNFLIGGAVELLYQIGHEETQKPKRTRVFEYLCKEALLAIINGDLNYLDFKHLDSMLNILFKSPIFVDIFIKKFSECYETKLSEYAHHETDEILRFFIKRVDEKMSPKNKYKAFSHVIMRWMNFSTSQQVFCVRRWPTNIIQKLFSKWFSLETAMDDISPLFNLLRYGEKSDGSELDKLAESIIIKCFDDPPEHLQLNFLKITGYYLIKHMEFTSSIANKIANYLEKYQKSKKKDMEEISWIIVVINILFLKGSLQEEERETTLKYLCTLDIYNIESPLASLVHIAIAFIYIFLNDDSSFWSRLSTMKQLERDEIFEDLELYAGFVPLVLKNNNFSTGFVLEKEKLINVIKGDNKIRSMRILLSLLSISLGTKHFSSNGKDTCDILKTLLEKDSADADELQFHSVLRTSMLCGGDFTTKYKEDENVEVEHYVTKKYIISIVGRHKLVVRHPLGVTVFNIEETGVKTLRIEECKQDEVSKPLQEEEHEEDQLDDGELDSFGKEIMKMNSFFHDDSEFVPYKQQPDPVTESDVYSMLVDMGFMNYGSDEFVKRIPEKMNSKVEYLDAIDPKSDLPCGVLQFRSGCDSFISEKNEKLVKLIHDLSSEGRDDGVFDTQLVSLTYTAPCLDPNENKKNTPIQNVRGMGFVVALNEDNSVINRESRDVKSFNFLIVLTPLGDYYDAELVVSDVTILMPFMADCRHWTVKDTEIGKFLSIIALMFFSFYNESKQRGPYMFIIKSTSRIEHITRLFRDVKQPSGLSLFARLRSDSP